MGKREEIGRRIRTMRKSRNMTQEDLAKAIDQSASSITMYETGRRHIVETFVNAVYLYDDHVDIITNNVENNERFKLDAIPDECSDVDMLGVPIVIHPNTLITIYRIAV